MRADGQTRSAHTRSFYGRIQIMNELNNFIVSLPDTKPQLRTEVVISVVAGRV